MPLFGPPNASKLKAKSDVPGLIKALDFKKDPLVRRDAAVALGELGDPRAVEPLRDGPALVVRQSPVAAAGADHHGGTRGDVLGRQVGRQGGNVGGLGAQGAGSARGPEDQGLAGEAFSLYPLAARRRRGGRRKASPCGEVTAHGFPGGEGKTEGGRGEDEEDSAHG
jgi:hypothetical protein